MVPVKDTVQLIIALLIGAVILFAGQRIMSWKQGYELSQQQTETAKATSGILKDSQQSAKEQEKQSSAIDTGREAFNNKTEEDRRNDPTVAERANRPVPDSLRRAYRERRLARDRLGCAGAGCGEEPSPDAAPER